MNHQLPKSLSSFIWHFLKQYKLIAAIFIFLGILAGFWSLLNAMLSKHIINIIHCFHFEFLAKALDFPHQKSAHTIN